MILDILIKQESILNVGVLKFQVQNKHKSVRLLSTHLLTFTNIR